MFGVAQTCATIFFWLIPRPRVVRGRTTYGDNHGAKPPGRVFEPCQQWVQRPALQAAEHAKWKNEKPVAGTARREARDEGPS